MSSITTAEIFQAPSLEELAPLFPNYRITNMIAQGGMGAVYRAVQISLDRVVAIKILPKTLSADQSFRDNFHSEAKVMAKLNHPNLIGVYDFGEVDNMLFIIMEFVPGQSLSHSSHGQAIDAKVVVDIITKICSGLENAHQNGILHRDIKPANILLDLSAQPKIGDFGLARPVSKKLREGEEIYGTPHYTAPEVLSSPDRVDQRADIFSVGVMLHELLTGKLPADDPRAPSVMIQCDSRLDKIVRRATHPDPVFRYPNIHEMITDLNNVFNPEVRQGPVTGARSRPSAPQITKPMPRRTTIIYNKSKSSSKLPLLLVAGALIYGAYHFTKGKLVLMPSQNKLVAEETEEGQVIGKASDARTAPSPENTSARRDFGSANAPAKAGSAKPTTASNPKKSNAKTTPFGSTEAPSGSDSSVDFVMPTEGGSSVSGGFNLDEFYVKARSIMKNRAANELKTVQSELKRNIEDYVGEVNGFYQKVSSLDERRNGTALANAFRVESKSKGDKLPEQLGSDVAQLEPFKKNFAMYSAKQNLILKNLEKKLVKHNQTYIYGLEKQIERLNSDKESIVIDQLKSEVLRARSDAKHFAELMTNG